jgi:translation initiation factor 2 alpha subunit (eIF-2alpha)
LFREACEEENVLLPRRLRIRVRQPSNAAGNAALETLPSPPVARGGRRALRNQFEASTNQRRSTRATDESEEEVLPSRRSRWLLKEAQEAKKISDDDREDTQHLLRNEQEVKETAEIAAKTLGSDLDEANRQLVSQRSELDSARRLLKEAQEAKKLSDDDREGTQQLLRNEQEVKETAEITAKKLGSDLDEANRQLVSQRSEHRESLRRIDTSRETVKALRNERDAKVRELGGALDANKRLVHESLVKLRETKKIADFNKDSLENVNKKLAESMDRLKRKEEELVSAKTALTRLRTKIDEIEKVDPKELEAIKQKLAKSDERNCKVTEVLSNSMQEMEKRLGKMKAALASERTERGQNLENPRVKKEDPDL